MVFRKFFLQRKTKREWERKILNIQFKPLTGSQQCQNNSSKDYSGTNTYWMSQNQNILEISQEILLELFPITSSRPMWFGSKVWKFGCFLSFLRILSQPAKSQSTVESSLRNPSDCFVLCKVQSELGLIWNF